ncbi:sulfurtransferase-like selenium metabolism protein YedF [Clostridium peptidivorans]|uniref:sulfurtransferase-like selenium metabolism protein YedF n=1 Tax=Clostridium peptidivorans TaxID=100174 RepID=UPI000BE3488A|nr:sulfurtransferase-like selenium metabolism protein YedF [Clostridium peptidivorans]
MDNIINCKGLNCPEPVINTKKYFDSINQGEGTVIVDNEVAKNNIIKFAKNNNYLSEIIKKESELYYIKVVKEAGNTKDKDLLNDGYTILVTTDKLGEGSEELGKILMKSYFYALSESDKLPTDIIFLNSGVFLTTEGSQILNILEAMSKKDIVISSCGTCLDFYNLKEKLKLGEISNMYFIVEKINNSTKVIKL